LFDLTAVIEVYSNVYLIANFVWDEEKQQHRITVHLEL